MSRSGHASEPWTQETDVCHEVGAEGRAGVDCHCSSEAGPLSRTLPPRLVLVVMALATLLGLLAIAADGVPAAMAQPTTTWSHRATRRAR